MSARERSREIGKSVRANAIAEVLKWMSKHPQFMDMSQEEQLKVATSVVDRVHARIEDRVLNGDPDATVPTGKMIVAPGTVIDLDAYFRT